MQDFAYVACGGFDRHISMYRGDGLDLGFGPRESEEQSQGVIDASIRVDDNPLHAGLYYFAEGVSAGAGAAGAGLSVRVRPSPSVTETKMQPGSPVI